MHPVLLILLIWLAVDAGLVALALFAARHRHRRFDAALGEMLEHAELHANAARPAPRRRSALAARAKAASQDP